MKISLNSIIDKIIWVMTVFLLMTFLIFRTYGWGKYAFLTIACLILCLTACKNRGKLRIRPAAFHWFMLAFCAYTLFSSLWAISAADAMSKAFTVFQILICVAMLYIHYEQENNIYSLLAAIMWAGYFVVFYTIAFFGLDYLMDATEDLRMESEYANSNSIGLIAALACTIQVNLFMHKKSRWSAIFLIPSVVVIAASQSRKALLFLAIGLCGVYLIKNIQSKGFFKKLFKLAIAAVVLFVVFSQLYSLPLFDGIRLRMDSMLAFFTGEGKADNSTVVRNQMAQLGLEWFAKYPLFGVGIGSPHILAGKYLAFDTYLHNNFAELLCGGGLTGFIIYYGMYVYLFVKLIQYRNVDKEHVGIGLVWMALMLIMDYGMVSYYAKEQWLYLMIHFLNVDHLEKKYKEQKNEHPSIA